MEPIYVFLGFTFGIACGFAFGYLLGHQDLQFENLKKSLMDFKKNVVSNFTPRQKVVILNSKDGYLPDEVEEFNEEGNLND